MICSSVHKNGLVLVPFDHLNHLWFHWSTCMVLLMQQLSPSSEGLRLLTSVSSLGKTNEALRSFAILPLPPLGGRGKMAKLRKVTNFFKSSGFTDQPLYAHHTTSEFLRCPAGQCTAPVPRPSMASAAGLVRGFDPRVCVYIPIYGYFRFERHHQ